MTKTTENGSLGGWRCLGQVETKKGQGTSLRRRTMTYILKRENNLCLLALPDFLFLVSVTPCFRLETNLHAK